MTGGATRIVASRRSRRAESGRGARMSFQELALLFVIGLLVLGPERLPRVARQIGRWVGTARRTANQLRFQIEREIALADAAKPATEVPSEPVTESGAATAMAAVRRADPESSDRDS